MGEQTSRPSFLCAALSSWVYKRQNKLPLRQSLFLGLPVGLTKHLCAGASIASGRVCKGIDLEDGLLMPILSIIGDVGPNAPDSERENFEYGGQTKKKRKGVDYGTPMNLYNLIFQMVELLYKLYYGISLPGR